MAAVTRAVECDAVVGYLWYSFPIPGREINTGIVQWDYQALKIGANELEQIDGNRCRPVPIVCLSHKSIFRRLQMRRLLRHSWSPDAVIREVKTWQG